MLLSVINAGRNKIDNFIHQLKIGQITQSKQKELAKTFKDEMNENEKLKLTDLIYEPYQDKKIQKNFLKVIEIDGYKVIDKILITPRPSESLPQQTIESSKAPPSSIVAKKPSWYRPIAASRQSATPSIAEPSIAASRQSATPSIAASRTTSAQPSIAAPSIAASRQSATPSIAPSRTTSAQPSSSLSIAASRQSATPSISAPSIERQKILHYFRKSLKANEYTDSKKNELQIIYKNFNEKERKYLDDVVNTDNDIYEKNNLNEIKVSEDSNTRKTKIIAEKIKEKIENGMDLDNVEFLLKNEIRLIPRENLSKMINTAIQNQHMEVHMTDEAKKILETVTQHAAQAVYQGKLEELEEGEIE